VDSDILGEQTKEHRDQFCLPNFRSDTEVVYSFPEATQQLHARDEKYTYLRCSTKGKNITVKYDHGFNSNNRMKNPATETMEHTR
jgi:hypothetical protein